MKKATATLRYLKMTPRKVSLIAGLVRGLPVAEAEAQLMVNPRRAAGPMLKLIRSAAANAEALDMDQNKLVISMLRVNQGPMLKRSLPRAFGRATEIQKKMSHVTIELTEDEKVDMPRFIIPKRIKIGAGADTVDSQTNDDKAN